MMKINKVMKGKLIKYANYYMVEYFGKDNTLDSLPKSNYSIPVNLEMVENNKQWFKDHLDKEVEYELGVHITEYEVDGVIKKHGIDQAVITELLDEKNVKLYNVLDTVIVSESLHKHDILCHLHGYSNTLIHVFSGSGGSAWKGNNYMATIITDEKPSDEFTLSFEAMAEHVKKGNVYTIINNKTNKVLEGRAIIDLKLTHLDLIQLNELDGSKLPTTLIYMDLFSESVDVEVRKVLNIYSEKNNTVISKITEQYLKRQFHEMQIDGFFPEIEDDEEYDELL